MRRLDAPFLLPAPRAAAQALFHFTDQPLHRAHPLQRLAHPLPQLGLLERHVSERDATELEHAGGSLEIPLVDQRVGPGVEGPDALRRVDAAAGDSFVATTGVRGTSEKRLHAAGPVARPVAHARVRSGIGDDLLVGGQRLHRPPGAPVQVPDLELSTRRELGALAESPGHGELGQGLRLRSLRAQELTGTEGGLGTECSRSREVPADRPVGLDRRRASPPPRLSLPAPQRELAAGRVVELGARAPEPRHLRLDPGDLG